MNLHQKKVIDCQKNQTTFEEILYKKEYDNDHNQRIVIKNLEFKTEL